MGRVCRPRAHRDIANPASSEIAATRKLHDDCRAALDCLGAFTGDYADGGALAVETNIAGAVINHRRAARRRVAAAAQGDGARQGRGHRVEGRVEDRQRHRDDHPGVVTDLELVLAEDPATLTIDSNPAVPTEGWVRVDAAAGAQIASTAPRWPPTIAAATSCRSASTTSRSPRPATCRIAAA